MFLPIVNVSQNLKSISWSLVFSLKREKRKTLKEKSDRNEWGKLTFFKVRGKLLGLCSRHSSYGQTKHIKSGPWPKETLNLGRGTISNKHSCSSTICMCQYRGAVGMWKRQLTPARNPDPSIQWGRQRRGAS